MVYAFLVWVLGYAYDSLRLIGNISTAMYDYNPGTSDLRPVKNGSIWSRRPPGAPISRDVEYVQSQEREGTATDTVPGHPRVQLDDHEAVTTFLLREYCSSDMDRMSKSLWMMSMQSHRNISALHRQKLKGREIIVTEDPKLHLVWFYDRIFLKPLPLHLCSYDFWTRQMGDDACKRDPRRVNVRAGALGYLRTWFFLIRHESDFRIASSPDLMLVPKGMSWNEFCTMSASFERIENADVCERYWYGEVRLTRLNFYAKLFLSKWSYQRMQSQYAQYFARFHAPLLFLIATISIFLNSLQLVLSVEQVFPWGWTAFGKVARWFAVFCCFFIIVVLSALAILLLTKIANEWRYALRDRFRRAAPQTEESGVRRVGWERQG